MKKKNQCESGMLKRRGTEGRMNGKRRLTQWNEYNKQSQRSKYKIIRNLYWHECVRGMATCTGVSGMNGKASKRKD